MNFGELDTRGTRRARQFWVLPRRHGSFWCNGHREQQESRVLVVLDTEAPGVLVVLEHRATEARRFGCIDTERHTEVRSFGVIGHRDGFWCIGMEGTESRVLVIEHRGQRRHGVVL